MADETPNSAGAPLLRRQEPLRRARVAEARLYVSALGVHDASVR